MRVISSRTFLSENLKPRRAGLLFGGATMSSVSAKRDFFTSVRTNLKAQYSGGFWANSGDFTESNQDETYDNNQSQEGQKADGIFACF